MNFIGFTLGLIGSLHCVIMCGPLVLGVSKMSDISGRKLYIHALIYNLGRISAYMLLGLAFASIGEALAIVGVQKTLSLISGIVLLVLLVFSMNIEKLLFKSSSIKSIYNSYAKYLSSRITTMAKQQPIALGFLNGMIPCGMVYVALIGSLSAASIGHGVLFMLGFGLGTLPMMFSIMVGAGFILKSKVVRLKHAVPIGQFILGVYLVFRGIMSAAPDSLI